MEKQLTDLGIALQKLSHDINNRLDQLEKKLNQVNDNVDELLADLNSRKRAMPTVTNPTTLKQQGVGLIGNRPLPQLPVRSPQVQSPPPPGPSGVVTDSAISVGPPVPSPVQPSPPDSPHDDYDSSSSSDMEGEVEGEIRSETGEEDEIVDPTLSLADYLDKKLYLRRELSNPLVLAIESGFSNLPIGNNALKNFLNKEKAYLHSLKLVLQGIMDSGIREGMVTKSEVSLIFCNVKDLADLSSAFLERIAHHMTLYVYELPKYMTQERHKDLTQMYKLYIELAEKAKIYYKYCFQQEEAQELVNKLEEEALRFKELIAKVVDDNFLIMDLVQWLKKPYERIFFYPILLKRLLNNIPHFQWSNEESHTDVTTLIIDASIKWVQDMKTQADKERATSPPLPARLHPLPTESPISPPPSVDNPLKISTAKEESESEIQSIPKASEGAIVSNSATENSKTGIFQVRPLKSSNQGTKLMFTLHRKSAEVPELESDFPETKNIPLPPKLLGLADSQGTDDLTLPDDLPPPILPSESQFTNIQPSKRNRSSFTNSGWLAGRLGNRRTSSSNILSGATDLATTPSGTALPLTMSTPSSGAVSPRRKGTSMVKLPSKKSLDADTFPKKGKKDKKKENGEKEYDKEKKKEMVPGGLKKKNALSKTRSGSFMGEKRRTKNSRGAEDDLGGSLHTVPPPQDEIGPPPPQDVPPPMDDVGPPPPDDEVGPPPPQDEVGPPPVQCLGSTSGAEEEE